MDVSCNDYRRETSLDYQSTWRAIGVVVIGFLAQAIFLVMILRLFGPSSKLNWKNSF